MAVAAAVGSAAVSLSLVLATDNPALAVRLWPANSIAQANLAAKLLAADSGIESTRAVARHAARALADEPGNVVAGRTMAAVEAARGHATASLAWLHYAERLSRRDLPTQLMLIEVQVARGNVAGALQHYDRALRTSQSSWPILFPVLSAAAANPEVTPGLIVILKKRPSWFEHFMSNFTAGPTPFASVYPVLRALRLDAAAPLDRELLTNALRKAVADKHYADAQSLLPSGHNTRVRNGNFEAENLLPPFDWVLDDDGGLTVAVEPVSEPARGNVLELAASDGQGGDAARQLLVLAPGRYALSLRSGSETSDTGTRPMVGIRCADTGQVLLRWQVPGSTSRVQQAFDVTSGCKAQWLSIGLTATKDGSSSRAWIDDVEITGIVGSR